MKGMIFRAAVVAAAATLTSAWAANQPPAGTPERPLGAPAEAPAAAPGTAGPSAQAPATTPDATRPMPAPDAARPMPAPAPADATPSRSAGTVMSDAGITARVKASLIGDERTKARNINVDTMNSVVTLKGTVHSEAEAVRAIEIARSTEGVTAVTSELQVGN